MLSILLAFIAVALLLVCVVGYLGILAGCGFLGAIFAVMAYNAWRAEAGT